MNKILLFGTVIFSILAFSGYKAFAQLREENKQPAAAAPKILIAYTAAIRKKLPKPFTKKSAAIFLKSKPKEAIPRHTAR